MPFKSHGGASYYVTFIDNATRQVWIYAMKSKNETFSYFKKFLSSVETQSKHKLKALCSDNGGEYVSKEFADFYSSRRIKRYWWPSVFKDSFEWCNRCDLCQHATRLENCLRPNNPIMTALPFEKWGVDYVGPITSTSKHGKAYIIVATDYLTKWSEARAVRSDDARTTATFLIDHVICRFGALAELVFNRGTLFLNDVLEDLTSYFNIRHNKTTLYKPSTDGKVESTNKTLVTILRKTVDVNKRDWDENLSTAVWAYNTTFKETTGFTPFSLVYGQECVLPIEHELATLRFLHEHSLPLEESLKERLVGKLEHLDEWRLRAYLNQEVAKKRQTKQKAKKAKIYEFEDGQLVLLYDAGHELFPGKLSHVWLGPYRIVKMVMESFLFGLSTLMELVVARIKLGVVCHSHPRKPYGLLVGDLGIVGETPVLHYDSQSAIQLARNPEFHAKTKHVDVRYHFIRDILEDKRLQLVKVHTDDNPVDLLTKRLSSERFAHLKELMAKARAAKAAAAAQQMPRQTMEQARQAQIEKAKKLRQEKQRIEAGQKAKEVEISSQSTQDPEEKEVVNLTSHMELRKKILRDKNLIEAKAAALARREEPREGESKRQES
ncbi:hypothetical protein L7F22_015869 [Adiantum nelumboides]|nr:hypothetical protein [Adiantum nelumboides]